MAKDIIPGTINGVENTSTFLSRPSENAIALSTNSSYVTYPVYIRAICLAPIIKREPVSFYARNTYNGVTSTNFLGIANFEDASATLRTTQISTGTNTIYCTWPGEGRWKGFTETFPQTLAVAPGIPYPGTLTLTRVGNSTPSTSTFIISSNTATTSSGLVKLLKDSVVYPAVITNVTTSSNKTGGTTGTSITTSTSSSTFVGNTVTTVINTSNVITITTSSIGGGQYSVTTSTSSTSVTTEYFTINNTISTGTFNTSTNSVSLVADPANLPAVVNVPYRVKGYWEGGAINGVYNMGKETGLLDLYTAVQPIVSINTSLVYRIYNKPVTFTATVVYPSGGFIDVGPTISFYDNGNLISTTSTTNNVATITVNGLSTGTHSISAVYNGSTSSNGFLTTSSLVDYYILSAPTSTYEVRTIPELPYSTIINQNTSTVFVLLTTNDGSTAVPTLNIDGANYIRTMPALNDGISVYTTATSTMPFGPTYRRSLYKALISGTGFSAYEWFNIGEIVTTDSTGTAIIGTIRNENPSGFTVRFVFRAADSLTLPNVSFKAAGISVRSSPATMSKDWNWAGNYGPDVEENGWVIQFGGIGSAPDGTYPVYIFNAQPNTRYRITRFESGK